MDDIFKRNRQLFLQKYDPVYRKEKLENYLDENANSTPAEYRPGATTYPHGYFIKDANTYNKSWQGIEDQELRNIEQLRGAKKRLIDKTMENFAKSRVDQGMLYSGKEDQNIYNINNYNPPDGIKANGSPYKDLLKNPSEVLNDLENKYINIILKAKANGKIRGG